MEMVHKAKLMELEHQIQKQRERTLALLDEKDKEICLLKSSFLSSFIKKDKCAESNTTYDTDAPASDQEAAASLLSNSLISSKKDGHILHYIQELSRKDIEISNLRHARVQTETTLRKLQQDSAILEEKYSQEIEELKSRLKLLESSQDKDGTNVEYLKNVVLRFLKCNDPKSRR
ncbi:GRIP and coiled-coil domain-containing protein 1, partial [Stegodyphus mimosarum]